MDQQYIERNIRDCETKIDSLDARIAKAKQTGESVKELREWRKGFAEKREDLLDQ